MYNNEILERLTDEVASLRRQVSVLQRQEFNATGGAPSGDVWMSGTPTLGAVTYWTAPGTIAPSTIYYSDAAGSVPMVLFGTASKTSTEAISLAAFGSNDAGTAQLQLLYQVWGNTTASDRAASIQSIEQGVALRALALNPYGGNVGVGTITPAYALEVVGDFNATGNIRKNGTPLSSVIHSTMTQGNNSGTGEDDLASYTVPANTVGAVGSSLWFEAFGSYANNANNKTIRVRFDGGVVFADSTSTPHTNQKWRVCGRIVRSDVATLKSATSLHAGQGGTSCTDYTSTGGIFFSNNIVLKVTGEATSTLDIVLEGLIVGVDNA